jgi:hypothetical protein
MAAAVKQAGHVAVELLVDGSDASRQGEFVDATGLGEVTDKAGADGEPVTPVIPVTLPCDITV